MSSRHRLVISAENNAYMAWQAKLAYFSCVTRIGQQPLIVVHETQQPWDSGFVELVRAGARVRSAPRCAPRCASTANTAGTLLLAADICHPDEFIVLCDPDMIFVRDVHFPDRLAAQPYGYMHYQWPEVEGVARQAGIPLATVHERELQLCCGVPYIIPAGIARDVALRWIEILEMFPKREPKWMWMDVMYAFGLALTDLGLTPELFDCVDQNSASGQPVQRDIIHYCMGDATWDKRQFADGQAAQVWTTQPASMPGSVLEEVLCQLSEAGRFYRGSIHWMGKGP